MGFFANFLIALGSVGLVKVSRNVLGLAITITIIKLIVAFLFRPDAGLTVFLLSEILFFVVSFVVFWLLVRYEDSFIVKILAVTALTLF